jgi:hypothetical protein
VKSHQISLAIDYPARLKFSPGLVDRPVAMAADRRHKCRPRTVEEFQQKLAELGEWIGNLAPPARAAEDRFGGIYTTEPGQFTQQLISLRDALQASAEPQPAQVRQR